MAKRWKQVLGILLSGVAAGVVGGGLCLFAAPPAGGSTPPPGRIYFSGWSMAADGSDKQQSRPGEPSQTQRYGSRWFLQFGTDPTDYSRQLFAIPEAPGSPVVQMTHGSYFASATNNVRWAKKDSFVSYVNSYVFYDVDGNPDTQKFEILTLRVDWATGEPIVDTQEMPTCVVSVLLDAKHPEVATNRGIASHDWSPDGLQVVYQLGVRIGTTLDKLPKLYVKDVDPSGVDVSAGLDLNIRGQDPAWSSNALVDRIAFTWYDQFARQGIATANPDGTGIVQLTKGTASVDDSGPVWSPDGAYIALTRATWYTKGASSYRVYDVYRIPAAGGKAVNLTGDWDAVATTVAWRP